MKTSTNADNQRPPMPEDKTATSQTTPPKVYPPLEGPSLSDMEAACDELYPGIIRVYTAQESAAIIRRAHELMRSRKVKH